MNYKFNSVNSPTEKDVDQLWAQALAQKILESLAQLWSSTEVQQEPTSGSKPVLGRPASPECGHTGIPGG